MMVRKGVRSVLGFLVVLVALAYLSGCAAIPEAIEHSDLSLKVKMTHSIFLDPTFKATHRNIFIEVKNTSQLQKFKPELLSQKLAMYLASKGYNIVSDPRKADYILQVNALYFDKYRKTATKEGASVGAAAGGIAGAAISGADQPSDLIVAAVGAGVGYIGGAIVGKALAINTFAGEVEVQIMEKAEKPIEMEIETNANQGSATTIKTRQVKKSNYQIYRTRIAVVATKTRLSEKEAVQAVIDKLAYEIANIF